MAGSRRPELLKLIGVRSAWVALAVPVWVAEKSIRLPSTRHSSMRLAPTESTAGSRLCPLVIPAKGLADLSLRETRVLGGVHPTYPRSRVEQRGNLL